MLPNCQSVKNLISVIPNSPVPSLITTVQVTLSSPRVEVVSLEICALNVGVCLVIGNVVVDVGGGVDVGMCELCVHISLVVVWRVGHEALVPVNFFFLWLVLDTLRVFQLDFQRLSLAFCVLSFLPGKFSTRGASS